MAGGEVYKWTDEKGNVHYSDSPPPDGEAIRLEEAPAPSADDVARATARLNRLLAEQDASAASREAERAEREQEREEALELALELRRECAMSRQNLHVLRRPRPVYFIDDEGRYVFYSDDERSAEIETLERFISENCDTL